MINHISQSTQLYWLTTNRDIFTGEDFWYHSPLKNHADMILIRKMPRTRVDVISNVEKINNTYYATVNITNSGEYHSN